MAVPYLKLFGTVAGGWMMARAALVAQEKLKQPDADRDFLQAKLATARFYAEHELPRALPLAREVTRGADSVLALDPAKFEMEPQINAINARPGNRTRRTRQ